MLPDITSWPRGSNISEVRTQSNSRSKWARFSIMVAPTSAGAPPVTTRTGLPQVWPSMQKKVWFMCVSLVIRVGFRTSITQRLHILQGLLDDGERALTFRAFQIQA